jgi:hypothetical protein
MSEQNQPLEKNPAPESAEDTGDGQRLEVKSKWFSVKLQEINALTLVAMAMILTTMVLIVALLAPA